MAIRVKTTIKRGVNRILKKTKKNFGNDLKSEIVDLVVEQITSGKSPVSPRTGGGKGKGRFVQYSKSYQKLKGRSGPVDFVVSGKFLGSMVAKQDSKGNVQIGFSNKKASDIFDGHSAKGSKHNKNLPLRRLLPANGEFFVKSIMNRMNRIFSKAFKKSNR